jgi:hypothetical protein
MTEPRWEELSPEGQAAHPDSPLEALRCLSSEHPEAVLANPALPLHLLARPAEAAAVLREARNARAVRGLAAGLSRAAPPLRRRFAADCVERLLAWYESQRPGERRPRVALEVARAYAAGGASAAELATAAADARATNLRLRGSDYWINGRRSWGPWFTYLAVDYTQPAAARSVRLDRDGLCAEIARAAARVAARTLSCEDALALANDVAWLAAQIAEEDRATAQREDVLQDGAGAAERFWQAERITALLRGA